MAPQILVLVGGEQQEASGLVSPPAGMCGTTYKTVPHLSLFQGSREMTKHLVTCPSYPQMAC